MLNFLSCISTYDVNNLGCQSSWALVSAILIISGGCTLLFMTWLYISYQLKLKAALEAEAKRQAVNHELIAEKRWRGEDTDPSLDFTPTGEIAKRIREEIQRRAA